MIDVIHCLSIQPQEGKQKEVKLKIVTKHMHVYSPEIT